ncbi:MAG: tetraacyldisaccharide 4'-kinase [Candidatus Omnitrophica bacterium]|nr:tetraacyldisaccharide 4'-kinase [Candidatus Omnitrophota bacterium]
MGRIGLTLRRYYISLVQGKEKGVLSSFFSFFLSILSFIYSIFVRLTLLLYRLKILPCQRQKCRVVSVGNITWGGTGKTPLVLALAEYFKLQGSNPGVLIRGYGQDEVEMLRSKLKEAPVITGKNRLKSAQEAQKHYGVDVLILDDGFQHWRLGRDLDIVLIDCISGLGNKRLIPRGMLREPLSSLSRADVFVLTHADAARGNIEGLKKTLRTYNCQAPIFEAEHSPCYLRDILTNQNHELSGIKKQGIAVLASIGNPQSLEKTLERMGITPGLTFFFPDHHLYTRADLEDIEKKCLQQKIELLLTTEKDVPKLLPLLKSQRVWLKVIALGVSFRFIKGEDSFYNYVQKGTKKSYYYNILVLNDGKAGHLNQSKAIARIIESIISKEGKSFGEVRTKIVDVSYKSFPLRWLLTLCSFFSGSACRNCMGCLRFCLNGKSCRELLETRGDIIVSAGSSLSAVNLILSYRNNSRRIHLMRPAIPGFKKFDLVIVPEHDKVKPGKNVFSTLITPNLIDRQYVDEQVESLKKRFSLGDARIPIAGPNVAFLIGGDTPTYAMGVKEVEKIVSQLKISAQNINAQILVTTSRRTKKDIEKLVKDNLANYFGCKLLVIANEKNYPEALGGILGLSDIVLVSGESTSMVSEAISAEKYVLVFMPQKKVKKTTKQERFLENLQQKGLVQIVQPEDINSEIERIWKNRPAKQKVEDRDLLSQALEKIL